MSGFLLDTNIVSEFRKGRRMNPGVRIWLNSVADQELFLSVLVIGEIRKGIELAKFKDAAKARSLDLWLSGLMKDFSDRMLSVTTAIADEWGRLSAIRPIPSIDGIMAATAIVHDLALVTRNLADVSHTGAIVINPFSQTETP